METKLEQLMRQISELEDVVDSLYCKEEAFWNDLCQIIFDGESNTDIGLHITLERIKERLKYENWLFDEFGEDK